MNVTRTWVPALITGLLLAACGGGGTDATGAAAAPTAQGFKRPFTAVVSFGDSLSDAGTYTPATQVPGSNPPFFLGGRFTTNSATSTIWVENVAASLGIALTPAEVGFGTQSVRCPAAANPSLARSCTAYGQGGARVTDPEGIRHRDPATRQLLALTVPIKTQIDNHLARFGGFRSSDLIFLWAGANDLLWEMQTDPAVNPDSFVIRLFTIQAQLQAGLIDGARAQVLLADAQAASLGAMRKAALDMAGYIRSGIVARGGSHVVVLNLPDPAVTPEGVATRAQSPLLGAMLTALSDAFNQGLKDGLAGQPVRLIDIRRFISDVVARPAAHRMANASVPACDAQKMAVVTGGAVTDGFSLFCNATPDPRVFGLRDGASVDTWFFADGNHPTTGGYRLIGREVMRQLRAARWIGDDGAEGEQ